MNGAEMQALFINPDHRGKGIGRLLVEQAAALHPLITTAVTNGMARPWDFTSS